MTTPTVTEPTRTEPTRTEPTGTHAETIEVEPPIVLPGGRRLGGVPAEHLEHEMLSLAGHLAAATCSFLLMVGEYDARRSWESWECLSCAHWLNWRCGVGMTAAREQVRVGRRLRELPVLREVFARGEISYSKVRAIARVAHPGNEAKLVELARWATASQLERACSALRRCADIADAEGQLRDDEERAELRRSLTWHNDADTGDLVVRLRIPAGAAADSFRSSVGAAVQDGDGHGDGHCDDHGDDAPEVVDELECRRLDALLDLVAAGAQVDSSLASQAEVVVHVTAGRADGRWPAITGSGQQVSLGSLEQICCDVGVRSVLDVPAVEPSVPDLAGQDLSALDAELWSSLTTSLDLGRHARFPSSALRRAVHRRDRGCCRFPGCDRRHRLHVHHIVWWERGGRTDRANLLLLCPKHHRAVHRGGWSLSGTADHAVFARDGDVVRSAAPQLQGRLAELVDEHRRHGLDIAADGAGSHWQGDHIDWDCFFAAFLPWDPGPDDDAAEHAPGDSAESPGPVRR